MTLNEREGTVAWGNYLVHPEAIDIAEETGVRVLDVEKLIRLGHIKIAGDALNRLGDQQ